MREEDDAAEFWAFSLALYRKPGVPEACLALQDRAGLDVNVALLCAWLGASGRGQLDWRAIAAAVRASRPWQHRVVTPLRTARRELKVMLEIGAFGALGEPLAQFRETLKARELEAERLEQRLLLQAVGAHAATARPADTRAQDAWASFKVYMGAVREKRSILAESAFSTLLAACGLALGKSATRA